VPLAFAATLATALATIVDSAVALATALAAALISALFAFASATVRIPSGLRAWHYVVSGVPSKGGRTSAGSGTTTNPADNAAILVRKVRI
jgi:hypothetical protein